VRTLIPLRSSVVRRGEVDGLLWRLELRRLDAVGQAAGATRRCDRSGRATQGQGFGGPDAI